MGTTPPALESHRATFYLKELPGGLRQDLITGPLYVEGNANTGRLETCKQDLPQSQERDGWMAREERRCQSLLPIPAPHLHPHPHFHTHSQVGDKPEIWLSQAKEATGCVLQTSRAAYKQGSCGTHGKPGDSTQNSLVFKRMALVTRSRARPWPSQARILPLPAPSTHSLHLKPFAPITQAPGKHRGSDPGRKTEVIPEANSLPSLPSDGLCPDLKIREDGQRTCQYESSLQFLLSSACGQPRHPWPVP